MSNLLESILRVGMTVFIVGPLTAWVARRGARERSEATDSLDCFTVRMPAAIRTIIACCAVAFELLMLPESLLPLRQPDSSSAAATAQLRRAFCLCVISVTLPFISLGVV